MYNIRKNSIQKKYTYNDIHFLSMAVYPARNLIALGAADNDIIILDLKNFKKLKILAKHQGEVSAVAFSPDGKTLASGSLDSTIILWNTSTWKETRRLKGHTEQILTLCFSKDNKYLFSSGWDNYIIIWNLKTFTGQVNKAHINVVSSLVHTNDLIISGSYDRTIKFWKLGK
jgi:WD40 repeat protein